MPGSMRGLLSVRCGDWKQYVGTLLRSENSRNLVKNLQREPVCGTDGNQYDSFCALKMHACKYQLDIAPVKFGQCDRETFFMCIFIDSFLQPTTRHAHEVLNWKSSRITPLKRKQRRDVRCCLFSTLQNAKTFRRSARYSLLEQ